MIFPDASVNVLFPEYVAFPVADPLTTLTRDCSKFCGDCSGKPIEAFISAIVFTNGVTTLPVARGVGRVEPNAFLTCSEPL